MIPQKLDHFYKLFSPNKSGGLWLSVTVYLFYIFKSGFFKVAATLLSCNYY